MTSNRPISDLLVKGSPVLSVEFFPPKDEAGGELIVRTALEIKEQVKPDFVSITYGAGGSTRERTFRYAKLLKDEYGFEVMPHLTCVGSSKDEIREIVAEWQDAGFCNIMALRGDPPKGETEFRPHPDGFPYADELVAFLRENFSGFSLGVAGYPEIHPEAPDGAADLVNLKRKVDAGGSFVTTQLFYDNSYFRSFVDGCRAAGITVPILPGLMPIRSAVQARRFCKHVPTELDAALREAGDDKAKIHEVGIDWTCRQIRELLAWGAPGVHLYIMNRSRMAVEVLRRLRAEGLFQAEPHPPAQSA
ncbi:MAG: methylenetetrahydrofolate reductase [NAD(P)H] [Opitutales bacterium]|nr:methylenetetrahydrofolate reductase [NAD(P)H] [Opitutales bacterium]